MRRGVALVISKNPHQHRLGRRVCPPTGRQGLPPVTFVFADTADAKVANTVAALGRAGRRYWCRDGTRFTTGGTALNCGQAVPVLVTTSEQLKEHGAGAAVWRRPGRASRR
ncbi:hypothetical protein ACIBBD_29090 [Streptomyces sp. NPDC051315]|uniref:hypothetical protein n=1 Tax=Streptomyces sp. NPDC051315 TaxID=3365650 RepID=UPI0037B2B5BC